MNSNETETDRHIEQQQQPQQQNKHRCNDMSSCCNYGSGKKILKSNCFHKSSGTRANFHLIYVRAHNHNHNNNCKYNKNNRIGIRNRKNKFNQLNYNRMTKRSSLRLINSNGDGPKSFGCCNMVNKSIECNNSKSIEGLHNRGAIKNKNKIRQTVCSTASSNSDCVINDHHSTSHVDLLQQDCYNVCYRGLERCKLSTQLTWIKRSTTTTNKPSMMTIIDSTSSTRSTTTSPTSQTTNNKLSLLLSITIVSACLMLILTPGKLCYPFCVLVLFVSTRIITIAPILFLSC